MKLAVCVDDTDDLTKTTSTGKVAGELEKLFNKLGGKVDLGITRHQLPLLKEIKYTSHNSSMCFTGNLPDEKYQKFITAAPEHVKLGSVPASDPGLCIYKIPAYPKDLSLKQIIAFGLHAKSNYVEKSEALKFASEDPNILLLELGGSGIGVIGALAGVGLRLSQDDGRFRGKRPLSVENGTLNAQEIIDELGGSGEAQIMCLDSGLVESHSPITLNGEVKLILKQGKKTLPVVQTASGYSAIDLQTLKETEDKHPDWEYLCGEFSYDNDVEEFSHLTGKCCANCLYRRWEEDGMSCVKDNLPV